MQFFAWVIYGLITSLAVWELFPMQTMGGYRAVIFLVAFLILGALDYFSSRIISPRQKFKFL